MRALWRVHLGTKSRWVTHLDLWWILSLSWSHLGVIWGLLAIILGPSGAHRRQLEGPLEIHVEQHQDKWLILVFEGSDFSWNQLGAIWGNLRARWRPFGNKIKMSDAFWFLLDSKSLLEPTWGTLGPSWDHLGTLWSLPRGNLRALWKVHLGPTSRWMIYFDFWWTLSLCWSQLGAIWDLLRSIAGLSGAYRGQHEDLWRVHLGTKSSWVP